MVRMLEQVNICRAFWINQARAIQHGLLFIYFYSFFYSFPLSLLPSLTFRHSLIHFILVVYLYFLNTVATFPQIFFHLLIRSI